MISNFKEYILQLLEVNNLKMKIYALLKFFEHARYYFCQRQRIYGIKSRFHLLPPQSVSKFTQKGVTTVIQQFYEIVACNVANLRYLHYSEMFIISGAKLIILQIYEVTMPIAYMLMVNCLTFFVCNLQAR